MTTFEYTVAADLDQAWLNFELDLPLVTLPDGRANPFYVERPDNPAATLARGLLRPHRQTPKYFFSGHRGCGKSTELRRLASDPKVCEKYCPVYFSIRDGADINDLDFTDILLTIGSHLYKDHVEHGGKLDEQTLKGLANWRTELDLVTRGLLGLERPADLASFFALLGAKMKLEPKARDELRPAFQRNLPVLIDTIDKISTAILVSRGRPPLVLIDDLDKPEITAIRSIFYDHREITLRPSCPIVYTVSNSLFYNAELNSAIFDQGVFLPSVRLSSQERPDERDAEGYRILREVVLRRMSTELIDQEALDEVVRFSGGVFREALRLVQRSIEQASAAAHERIERSDVYRVATQIRSEFRRFLTQENLTTLRHIRRHHQAQDPEELSSLLASLAVLEYRGQDGEVWWDVHPVLEPLLSGGDEVGSVAVAEPAKAYHLRHLRLEGVRGFRALDLDLEVSSNKNTIVIGRNGTCKTTLLRCIAMALAGDKEAPALLSSPNGRWITDGEERGSIQLHLEPLDGGKTIVRRLEIVRDNGDELVQSDESTSEKIFVCAYGMGRGNFGDEFGRDYRVMDSVATLFDYGERLVPSELVLRRLNDFLGSRRFDAVLSGLKRALGLSPDHLIDFPPGGGVEISGPDLGGRIPLEGWADGYRMTFSWLIDFYGWAMRAGAFDKNGDVCGILMIDEIEQHLHPAMQRDILGHLERALPKIQIIATTHSPMVALSVQAEQIIALHRDGERVYDVPVPPLNGYSFEDVLVEEALFGTNPYGPTTEAYLRRYQELAQIAPEQRSPEQSDELLELARVLDPRSSPGLRDDPVLAKLDDIEALLRPKGPDA